MQIHALNFRGYSCFKDEWSSLPEIKPINLIIGKNNSGKSHLLDYIEKLTRLKTRECSRSVVSASLLDEASLQQVFKKGARGGPFADDHWLAHGKYFTDQLVIWNSELSENPLRFSDDFSPDVRFANNQNILTKRLKLLESMFIDAKHLLHGRSYRQLLADRDIQPEAASNKLELEPNGDGATNIVRRFLTSDNPKYPRELVRSNMLNALNTIFGEDGKFSEISIQHKDGNDPEKPEDLWEIYLAQEHKGLIALSQSGSSLKTVFLVLLNILAIPKIEDTRGPEEYIFALEELENNLHPSLLRRLLSYIESYVRRDTPHLIHSHPVFFLTTHSNVSLDYFADQEFAQILHITHDGVSAQVKPIVQSKDQLAILRDLGSKPSDLLQANGIIWVEGPSDRIYLNKWIELWSDGKYKEGRHYQCMFYGGGLLSNLQATSEEDATKELINLMKINPNGIVVSDSDKKTNRSHLKPRVKRIREEFAELNQAYSFHWILSAREVENYLTGDLINQALQRPITNLKAPEQYESFFPKKSTPDESYMETKLDRKSFDKTDLAIATTPHMTKATLATRFDLDASMTKVISLIKTWNQ